MRSSNERERSVAERSDIHFSPRAGHDIDKIYDRTEAKWGFEQAEKYIYELKAACHGLAETPRLGRSIDHFRRGYFILGCGSHNIFFREEKTRIVVIRILHNRMDPARHL